MSCIASLTIEASLFAILAASIELLLRLFWLGTPPYRRHLIIFVILGTLGALNAGFNPLLVHRGCVSGHIFFDFFGVGIGLTLSSLPWLWGRRLGGLGWQRGTGVRKNPLAPLILVADPHWHESLVGLNEARFAHPGADWLFLGDLFDIWVGIPERHTDLEREFLEWVSESRSNDVWVGLWLGNREFFLDHLSDQFDLMGEGVGGQLVSEGLCWEHGDLINGTDWRYRLWNIVLRSSAAWIIVRFLPSFLVDGIVNRLKKSVRSAGRVRKSTFPEKSFKEVAAAHYGKTFVTGHFHTYKIHGNGISLPWAKDGKFMVWYKGEVNDLDCLNR